MAGFPLNLTISPKEGFSLNIIGADTGLVREVLDLFRNKNI